jgi:predicted LPLAT superfamily acyltransferase
LRVGDAVREDTQVKRRRAEVSKEVAHEALDTALATEDVVALRRSAEAGWRNEQDVERLRARAVRVCEQIPALSPRLERVRATPDTAELVEVGVEAVSTASRDVLCVMAVQTAAYEGVDVNTEVEAGEETGDRWLLAAARDGLVQTTRALLEAGAKANLGTIDGYTALHVAAQDGHLEVVQALLEAEAEVNLSTTTGCTALYLAAQNGHVQVVQALLELGRMRTMLATTEALRCMWQLRTAICRWFRRCWRRRRR